MLLLDELITALQARRAQVGNVRVGIAVDAHDVHINGRPAQATISDLHPVELEQFGPDRIVVLVAAAEFAVVRHDGQQNYTLEPMERQP